MLVSGASGRCLGPDVHRSPATGAAGLGSGTVGRAGDESGAAVRSGIGPHFARAVDAAAHRAAVTAGDCGSAAPSTAGQAVLSLTARYGKDLPVINSGLVWRVFADRPDETGTFKLIREDRGATPNIVLPPGSYVVHVAFGLVSAVRPVTLKSETDRESFVLPAGGLRIEGRVGTSKIPQNQISFAIYKGSQFEVGERAPLVPNVSAGDVALLPEGTYYIISNYGDANSVVRSDIRVQAGKLTDVTITPSRRRHHAEAGQRQGRRGAGQHRMVGDHAGRRRHQGIDRRIPPRRTVRRRIPRHRQERRQGVRASVQRRQRRRRRGRGHRALVRREDPTRQTVIVANAH